MGFVWALVIGFVAGLIVQAVTPGRDQPSRFTLTTIVAIVGALVGTWLGQALGWGASGQGAGLVGAVMGTVVILLIWSLLSHRRRT